MTNEHYAGGRSERVRDSILPVYFSFALLIFVLSFFVLESSGRRSTLFYISTALPALLTAPLYVGWLWKNACARLLWLFLLAHVLLLWLHAGVDAALLKEPLYLALLSVGLAAALNQRRTFNRACFTFFAACAALGLFAIGAGLVDLASTGSLARLTLLPALSNPVHAALAILTGWLGFWFIYALPKYRERGRGWLVGGYVLMLSFAALVCVVFQARSALVGTAVAVVIYVLMQKERKLGLAILALITVVLVGSGLGDALLQRGLSYRVEIWTEALRRLTTDCSWLLGCGRDSGYMYLGQFYHAHSAYVTILVETGALGMIAFLTFAAWFAYCGLTTRSPWFALAMFGWGGLLTTSSGIVMPPHILWIYFWIPTVVAMLTFSRPQGDRRDAANESGV